MLKFFQNSGRERSEEALPPVTSKAFSQNHHERGEDLYFTNTLTGKKHRLVTSKGIFVDFPGIEDFPGADAEERACIAKAREKRQVWYGVYFETFGRENYVVWWTAQPDGRYWEDEDGFGGTSDSEIQFYALMDRTGHYTGPFRLRKTGSTYYAWNYDRLSLRFRRDFIAGDGSRRIDIVDQQYESGKEPPMRRVPVPQVSYYNSSEGFLYHGKKYADIEALKNNLLSQIYGFKSFVLEFREPLSDGTSAEDGRFRHYLYMIDRGQVNCVSCEDGGKGFTVTMDADRVNAFVWKEMVRTRFARDEDIFVVSSNYSALSLARGMARS